VEAIPIAPVSPPVPLAVAALSYAGRLVVTVNAGAAVGDLDVLVDGTARGFAELARLTRDRAHPVFS
jgi:diacylglycerol O-acyltransferase / wax synthase